jgi:pimeloyl-ACP methyl ester carboxylesterase
MDLVAERYRAYALDFWGFGESEREKGTFTIGEYVECLLAFMDELGIQKVNLVGHGMGGMVAMRAAQKYPDRFIRLMLVATPLQGKLVGELIKPGKLSRLLGRNSPVSIWSKLIRQIPVDDPDVQQELYDDTDSLSETVVQRVQDSMLNTDLLPTIPELSDMSVLAVYGEKDALVPPDHADVLNGEGERPHQLLILPQANHFPFLEHTATFSRLLMDFIQSEKGKPVEVKEHWRRRVSQREYL